MRLSRRVSHIPSLQTPTLPGPACAHCTRPLSIHTAYIRCAEPICDSLPLCPDCFSVGAHDVRPHQPSHAYRVVEKVVDPIYAKDWAAHEEERLLHALSDHGPNHWKDVSDYVRSKTPAKCERHYHQVYLDGNMAPLPTETATATNDVLAEPPSPAPGTEGKKVQSDGKHQLNERKDAHADAEERTVKPGVKAGVLEGYMPLRGDFDVEWDDEAENLVADLTIGPDDTEEELELKMCLLENYDQRLKRRDAVKQILFDHNLLDFGSHKIGGSRTAKDEKELAARLKVFARLLDKNMYAGVQESVTNTYRLSREVHRLAQARDAGVQRLAEVDIYEVERKARAARLSAGKGPEKSTRKKRGSNGGMGSSAKRARKNDGARGSVPNGKGRALHSPAIVLDESTALMYSPTPDVDALSLGVSSSDIVNTYAAEADDLDECGEVPAQSKTAMLRKAREQRRMMRSTYPQVEAGDVKSMPGAADLTEPELVLCCALKLPPAEFITLRDAMLSAFGETTGPSTSVASESANRHITTMRATRSRTRIENNEHSDTSRIQVTHTSRQVTGRPSPRALKTNEAIKPGAWRGKRVTRVTCANSQQSADGIPAPCSLQYTTVELDGVPTHSQGEAAVSRLASDGVSSATCVENDMRLDDESRKCNVKGVASGLKTEKANFEEGNICSTVDIEGRAKDGTPDIVAESVGRSGLRLVLSLFLPKDDAKCASVEDQRSVKVDIDIFSDTVAREVGTPTANQSFGKIASSALPKETLNSRSQAGFDPGSVSTSIIPVRPRTSPATPRKRSRKGRAAGRLTIRKRSRGQGRSRGRKSAPGTAGRTPVEKAANPSSVKVETHLPEGVIPAGGNGEVVQSADGRKQQTEVTEGLSQGFGEEQKDRNGREARNAIRTLGGRSGERGCKDGEDLDIRCGEDYDRFANGAVQEEVLEEGNAASLEGRSSDVFPKSVSGETLDKPMRNVGSSYEGTPVKIDEFIYVAPKPSQAGPLSTGLANQSVQGSESEESDANMIDMRIQTSVLHRSESNSPVESVSGDDDGDPSVDFSLAEEGSDDDDIEDDGKQALLETRRTGGRRPAGFMPLRVSSRIRKRKRLDNPDCIEISERQLKRPRADDMDEDWALGVDVPGGSRPSGKKPPATPVRKSARKRRPRSTEEANETPVRTPNGGRYSLRRRG